MGIDMRFVIVTGMSGAGRSSVMRILEDDGYFCVDNLPVPLIEKFVELIATPNSEISKVALGLDVRADQPFGDAQRVLDELKENGYFFEILFMDASDAVLLKRYKETRRMHPLSLEGRVEEGVHKEREILQGIKKKADYVIDTSNLLTRELKEEIDHIFVRNEEYNSLMVTILSFGFKNGIPADADLVFDVRFLPNPFYIDELKHKTGNDKEVQDYVMSFPEALVFVYFYNALNNLWFLWAVWWCFLVVFVMHCFLRDNIAIYVLCFLALFVIPDGLGLGAYKYMLPYFLFGYYMHACMQHRQWRLDFRPKIWVVAGAGLAFAGLFLYYDRDSFIYLTGYKLVGKQVKEQLWIDVYRMLVGFAGSLFFVLLWQYIVICFDDQNEIRKVKIKWNMLRQLGMHSMGVYILSGYLVIFLIQRLDFIDHPSYVWNILETVAVLAASLCGAIILGKIPVLKRLVGK